MIRRILILLTLVMVLVPTTTGCRRRVTAPLPSIDRPDVTRPVPEPYNDGTLMILSGLQVGDMGNITDYAGDAVASNATYYGSGSSFRLDSLGDDWWVMSYLSISNLDLVNAAPGTYRATSGVYDEAAPQVSVTGCSGPTYGNYTYDAGAQDTEIIITDNGDGTRTLDWTARFDFGGTIQDASGTIVYRQGDVAPPTTTTELPIIASDASQSGSMGNITSYEGSADVSTGYYMGRSSSLRLDSVGDDWWVMMYLYVDNLDLREVPAGTYRYISGVATEGEPTIGVTGCSGPSYGNYTFDSGSQDAEIVITDNEDGSRTLDVTALYTYGAASQTAHARMTIRIGEGTVRGAPTTF